MTEPESHYNEKIEKNNARIKELKKMISKLKEENARLERKKNFY